MTAQDKIQSHKTNLSFPRTTCHGASVVLIWIVCRRLKRLRFRLSRELCCIADLRRIAAEEKWLSFLAVRGALLHSFDSLRKVLVKASTSLVHRRIASNSPCAIKRLYVSSADIKRGSRYPSLTIKRSQRTMPAPRRATWRLFGRHQTGVPLPITDEWAHCIKLPLRR